MDIGINLFFKNESTIKVEKSFENVPAGIGRDKDYCRRSDHDSGQDFPAKKIRI